ncbi:MAG: hypothetical protein UH678_01585, partial [Fibrobacteraceae bacterium]|nr:hypothetical protein [Fibrobacteraceae bacterium]
MVFLFSVFSFSQDSLEQVSPEKFQNQILRSERLKKIAADSSRSKEQREFANAAVLYYSGNFEEASKQYESLLTQNDSLAGNILLRLAEIHLQSKNFTE